MESLLFFGAIVVIIGICWGLFLLNSHCEEKYAYKPLTIRTLLIAFIPLLCVVVGGIILGSSSQNGEVVLTANAIVFFVVALLTQVGLTWYLTKKTNLAIGLGISICLFFIAILTIFIIFIISTIKESIKSAKTKSN